jgi:signal transduction histidine kinase/putative methionine-R-sulfoxide reductase with GAF domain
MNSVAPRISNIADWDSTTDELLHHCMAQLLAESASIFLSERKRENLRLVKAVGSRANRHCGKTIKMGEGIAGLVANEKKPLLVSDLSHAAAYITRKENHKVDTFMSYPVVQDSAVLAVINVAGRVTERPFCEKDLEIFGSIAESSAALIERTINRWSSIATNLQLSGGAIFPAETLEDFDKCLQGLKAYDSYVGRNFLQYVWIFDRELTITSFSREESFVASYDQPEGVGTPGRSILDLPFDVDRGELAGNLRSMLKAGTPFSLKSVRVTGCTEFRVVNMSFSPFFSGTGQILGGLLLMEDDTENYIIRRRLVNAEKLSLVGSLTSMITHEINNPLDSVMRLINLSLRQVDDQDPVHEYLGEAQKGMQRMASLVKSLLNFSRKSVVLETEFMPLSKIIENVVSTIRDRNEGKHVAFRMDLASEDIAVRANDFYQILGNLLSNSFDAIKDDAGAVRLRTEMDDDRLLLIVEDNGCGIPEDKQQRIFNTFWTTKEQGKGTGLGLAIVKKLVEKYDGNIEVESKEDVGAKICLSFPLQSLIAQNMGLL